MGVTGLWQILQPCARPTNISTLNRKRLAVDASIWIYQFLKAVRDKEGNALRNSHVVGFFRRICKLLFFGIKPVFVFDGGAPALKRQTVMGRKRRREGRRDDAVRTAGRMLAVQMQRRVEEEEEKRREAKGRRQEEEEAVPDEGLVYVDELQMSAQERQQNRKFRKTDAYHLPDLESNMHAMGQPNDPRVMSLEELEAYAKQFSTDEDSINVYDFSKIDYDSPFFQSLPASDRYNILNAARLRSRLRMGHSKEQLDSMFPDRMAFSRFQIDRVRERNELTTRLMNINDGDVKYSAAGNRVAGEKAREYVLVKNDGVEGGYALCVISEEGTKRETAIDVDKPQPTKVEISSEDEDDGFEDVPIEGLNRLPKRKRPEDEVDAGPSAAVRKARRANGASQRSRKPRRPAQEDPESLFVADEQGSDMDVDEEEQWEDVAAESELFGDEPVEMLDEDEDLRRAIALSLETGDAKHEPVPSEDATPEEKEDWYASFQQRRAAEARPVPKGSARAIANILNKRANEAAPDSHETTSFGVPVPKPDVEVVPLVQEESGDEAGMMDLQVALAESRRGMSKTTPPPQRSVQPTPRTTPKRAQQAAPTNSDTPGKKRLGGPLPFESLDLGSSILGKKKMQQRQEEAEGGFEKADMAAKEAAKVEPLPPWFNGDLQKDMEKQARLERADRERAREFGKQFAFEKPTLMRNATGEVIDLEAEEEESGMVVPKKGGKGQEVIDLSDDKDGNDGVVTAPELTGLPVDDELRMGDLAEAVRVDPPTPHMRKQSGRVKPGPFEIDDDVEIEADFVTEVEPAEPSMRSKAGRTRELPLPAAVHEAPSGEPPEPAMRGQAGRLKDTPSEVDDGGEGEAEVTAERNNVTDSRSAKPGPFAEDADDDEYIVWSDSEEESPTLATLKDAHYTTSQLDARPIGGQRVSPNRQQTPELRLEDVEKVSATNGHVDTASKSPSVGFEDVDMTATETARARTATPPGLPMEDGEPEGPIPASGLVAQESVPEFDDAEFDDFEDPEEEELLKALTLEAEEHARFASTLNQKSAAQNIAEYEKELKQLRNQQKKDRRDADEVTHIMIQECQQLLRLFGLPYVTAPMEAEAQCAELVHLGLVDGIVTDDSDCFLFGGTRVYKNMFNQAKFVECYLASDLEKEFELTRPKLIAIAQLLGSDYTEGLNGVGPVTALEILGEFSEGGLLAFRDWWSGVQMNTIPKEADKDHPFRKKFRKNATKLFLPPAFPDTRVELAYTNPEVDSNPEPFQWGVPDLDALRSFLMATIGWSQERTDEVLVPVIRDMNRRADEGTQANITAFFDGGVGVGAAGMNEKGEAFAPRKKVDASKRMGKALGRMAERAKVQRTLSRAEDEGRIDMSTVEGVAVADDAPGPEVRANQSGGKRKAASQPARADEEDDEDGSEFEAPKRKSNGRKATKPARGARSKRKAADAED
jgi:DNA excision repair protein ERCC-5